MDNVIKRVDGWILNGCMPTEKKENVKCNDIVFYTDIKKFKFLKGLDTNNQVVIYDTGESGAWDQLRETINLESVKYDKDKMLRLVKKDLLLARMYSGLGENDDTLFVLFNSEVLGDSAMIQDYMNA